MARGTPTAIPRIVLFLGFAVGGWAKLVGTVLELCNVVGAREPVRLMIEVLGVAAVVDNGVSAAVLVRLEKRGLVESVAVESSEVPAVAERPDLSIVENGYGSSEVVEFVAQQFSPPSSGGPTQHQLLPLGAQRLIDN